MNHPECIFASDFHLSSSKPEVLSLFKRFIEERVRGAASFYILGDLFDYWFGKSMFEETGLDPAFDPLESLARSGTAVTFLHGNRDFLLNRSDARRLGMALSEGAVLVEREGQRIYLCHGDEFCTRDHAYQRMKRIIRNPLIIKTIRVLPSSISAWMARGLRGYSKKVVQRKTKESTSLDREAIQLKMKEGVTAVVCGHVHTARDEDFPGGGRLFVLSDWTAKGGTYGSLDRGELALKLFSD